MSGEPAADSSEIQSITVQLANLDITITVQPSRRVGSAAGPSSAYPFATGAVALAPPDPADFPLVLEEQAIAAVTAADLGALSLPFLQVHQGHLRAQHPHWTARARVGRAFRAGVIAGRRLAGEYLEHTSPAIPNRNTVYIVLRGKPGSRGEQGFWTTDYSTYIQGVQAGGDFHRDSVSHAFATQAEVSCYLAGARRGWPVQL